MKKQALSKYYLLGKICYVVHGLLPKHPAWELTKILQCIRVTEGNSEYITARNTPEQTNKGVMMDGLLCSENANVPHIPIEVSMVLTTATSEVLVHRLYQKTLYMGAYMFMIVTPCEIALYKIAIANTLPTYQLVALLPVQTVKQRKEILSPVYEKNLQDSWLTMLPIIAAEITAFASKPINSL